MSISISDAGKVSARGSWSANTPVDQIRYRVVNTSTGNIVVENYILITGTGSGVWSTFYNELPEGNYKSTAYLRRTDGTYYAGTDKLFVVEAAPPPEPEPPPPDPEPEPPSPTITPLFYDDLSDFDNWVVHSPEYNGGQVTPAQSDPWITVHNTGGSPLKLANGAAAQPKFARFITKQGVQSAYDKANNTPGTRTGLYKGYQYEHGEVSLTTIDFRRAAGYPNDLATGGGNNNQSQCAQEKAWGDVVDFQAQQVGRDGFKFAYASNDNLILKCPVDKWIRLGLKASWRYDSQGWYEWWVDLADGQGFRRVRQRTSAQLLNRPGIGDCFLCLGLYHVLTGWPDVSLDIANPTVVPAAP